MAPYKKVFKSAKVENNKTPTCIPGLLWDPKECPVPIAKIRDEQKRDNIGTVGINPNQFKFNIWKGLA